MKSNAIKDSFGDRVFLVVDYTVLFFLMVIIIIPLLNVVSCSFSNPAAVGGGRVLILPVGFNVEAYVQLFKDKTLMTGFRNSVFYTISGTMINIIMTVMCAYPLSRDIPYKKYFMFYFTFTMLFGGGMIPNYLLLKSLGFINNPLVMIVPGAMSVSNMIIARTFFMNTIPKELYEAADMDGATDFRVIFQVVLPLSTPIIAVLTLMYAVGHWNSYFRGFLYLSKPELFNLQMTLRNVIANIKMMMDSSGITDSIAEAQERALFQEVLKYAVIVFTSFPILMLYPFVQKHFVKGIMIGSLKG